MKIAILSDTHNNEDGVLQVIKQLSKEGIDTIIHCGDMTNASTAELFSDFCIHHVFGNGDLDTYGIQFALECCKAGSTSGSIYTGVVDGKTFAALHGNHMDLLYTLQESGKFDYIFHGHTHQRQDEMEGKTRVINPGAIGGAHRGKRGFCTVDFASGEVIFHDLNDDK